MNISVQSPYFKKTKGNGVLCLACNQLLKHERLWLGHKNGRQHVSAVIRMEKKNLMKRKNVEVLSEIDLKQKRIEEPNEDEKEIENVNELTEEEVKFLNEKFEEKPSRIEDDIVGIVREELEDSPKKIEEISKKIEERKEENDMFNYQLDDLYKNSIRHHDKYEKKKKNWKKKSECSIDELERRRSKKKKRKLRKTLKKMDNKNLPADFFDDELLNRDLREEKMKMEIDSEMKKFSDQVKIFVNQSDQVEDVESLKKFERGKQLDSLAEEERWSKLVELFKKKDEIIPTVTSRMKKDLKGENCEMMEKEEDNSESEDETMKEDLDNFYNNLNNFIFRIFLFRYLLMMFTSNFRRIINYHGRLGMIVRRKNDYRERWKELDRQLMEDQKKKLGKRQIVKLEELDESEYDVPIRKEKKKKKKSEEEMIEKKEVKEINGPKGPEPTRYGDWERKGRCIDF
ncbi:hypothetical protein SNEBB_001264 [Seison nebaliae]|nr:hypothetical protein SNEBB_001264 [Seison nebaliae]